ncbi:MAG: GAF domain-containing sensor histidine kinase [Acidobacteriota bacterium]
MNLRRLKWIAILAPVLFIGMLEYGWWAFADVLPSLPGRLLMDGVILVAALFLYGALFDTIGAVQRELERRNRELVALRNAGMAIASELSLDTVLQKVVEESRRLLDTRYGALSVMDGDGRIAAFVTTGVDDETRARIGSPPSGHGLLGVTLHEGESLRVEDIESDQRAVGLPPNHPPMHSLLAVPVIGRGTFRGNLYLSEKEDGTPFDDDDELMLEQFATQAAIAIDNAELHLRVRSLAMAEERLRLAHEMHDGQAQVLAYVNTKAQAVREFLRRGKDDEAQAQLEQLAAAARQVYDDVREGILGLRTASDAQGDLAAAVRSYLEQWRDQCDDIEVDTRIDDVAPLRPDVELQWLRIFQESLSNVRKHARANKVEVALGVDADRLVAKVCDDGVGFDPDALSARGARPRFGLATMRERAGTIGADLEIDSQPGDGTQVTISLPLGRASAESEAPMSLFAS